MQHPYCCQSSKGIANFGEEHLKETVSIFDKEGLQIHIHAIGKVKKLLRNF